jgi:cytidylate kinase
MHRIHSPLKKAADAVLIDSTHRSAEEVVKEMDQVVISHGKRKKGLKSRLTL